ncbi:MAG: multidrug efflux system membrane fusion protein, partial [Myxococcota bacterium]
MSDSDALHNPDPGPPVAPRARAVAVAIVTTLLLLVAFRAGGWALGKMKEEPARKSTPPAVRVVDVTAVRVSDHEVRITGNATAAPARVVSLVSEVSGRVLQAHPNLRPGGLIKKGEVLVELDR